MIYGISLVFFVIICICLVTIILLQASKSGGMGTAMGQQAMGAAFGGEGGDKLLVKITSVLAFMYMFLAVIINLLLSPSANTSPGGIIEKNIRLDNTVTNPADFDIESSTLDTTK
tara:strand:- start:237 stop:581 length:345 start_codon:yes stop_codon:yes gene_type:complete